jgi:hypothetical protein
MEIQGPDGAIIEFPDGTSHDIIKGAMAKRYGAPKPQTYDNGPVGSLQPKFNVPPRAGDAWADPETGEEKLVVEPSLSRKPGEVTIADIEARQKVLANKPVHVPQPAILMDGATMGPGDSAGMAKSANDPAFVNKVIAGTPEASRALAIQILGGQRAMGRGPLETGVREAVNTFGMNIPRLVASAMTPGIPTAVEHEIEKAADAAGARNSPGAAGVGRFVGLGGQAASIPASATAGLARGGLAGALLAGAPVAADTRGNIGEIAKAAITGGATGALGAGLFGGPTKSQIRADVIRNAPSREALKEAENKAYEAARGLDVQYSQPSFSRAIQEARDTMRSEGLDKTLHPKATAALGRADEFAATAPTLQEVETLRRITGDAAKTPDEGRVAGILRRRVDDFVENAGPQDVVRGDPAQAGILLRDARGNSSAGKRTDAVHQAMRRATENADTAYSGGNIDNAIRQQFKALSRDEKAMRGFSAEEREAIRDVMSGGLTRNAARLIGKLMPSSGLGGAVVGGGAVSALGPAGALVPAVGYVAKALADRGTKKAAEYADALVRSRSPLAKALAEQNGVPAIMQEASPNKMLLARVLAAQTRQPIGAGQ